MKGLRGGMNRLAADTAGNIAITAAICAPLIFYTLGLGVDYGMVTLQKQHLQQLSDVSAIVAASDIGHAPQNLVTNFSQNGLNVAVRTVAGYVTQQGTRQLSEAELGTFDAVANFIPGTYVADPSRDYGTRFSAGTQPYDAVKVELTQKAELVFAATFTTAPTLHATGTASASKLAAFSVGSRIASLNGGVLNGLLGSLLGTDLSLKVGDYEALATANVELLSFLDTLATDLNLTAGSYEDVLATEITYPRLLTTLKKTSGLTPAVTKSLDAIQKALGTTQLKLKLEDLLSLGSTGERMVGTGSNLSIDASLMDILSAAAIAANQQKQVAVNLTGTVPGLATTKLTLAIGEPPKGMTSNAVGSTGSAVRTAQVRLAIEVNVLGAASIAGIKLRVPLYVEAGYAEAKLASISCLGGGAKNANVSVDVVPGVAEIDLGDVDTGAFANFGSKPRVSRAKIIDLALLNVSALAQINATNQTKTRLTFQPQDIAAKTIKNVSTKDTLTSTVASLLTNTDVQVNILGLGIGLPKATIQGAVLDTLTGVTKPLDELLYSTLTMLGVKIGEADVRVTDVRCQQSVLVQ